ncbi:hypothetical protein DICPUDRAFT_75798 [Dictyostelium purpureum]|uniref:CRAL-TRIO domain-containing protein n=1 Tax=Dictyostelium purpureum TaxID=5786 RepID=F0ZBP7_DICPU|nr:uncharacterized protein DICPUDRAFT_75798 [Dictyostelium purpureum]EGC38635.1 hypothetical protein DICPUDRAFT_75798 [Dictyostelium purpureum]|eukprot:XP_003284828.1 hypothetical protein DICPUDRAFT_75798 [Dictyostelium purpureum]
MEVETDVTTTSNTAGSTTTAEPTFSPPVLTEGEVFDPLKNLNEKQLEAFKEMKNLFSDLTDPTDIEFCTDMCLLRYLRARNYTVAKSEKMLRDTLEWRKKYRPQDIQLGGDIREIGAEGCVYVNQRDKKGRPIIWAVPRNDTLKDVPSDIKFKNLVYWMEQGFKRMDESKGIEQFCFIVDYKDFSSGNMDMKTNLEAMHFLLDHCPEIGSYFIATPFLAWEYPIYGGQYQSRSLIKKIRWMHHVWEKSLGGDLDYTYNIDNYLLENPDPIVERKEGDEPELTSKEKKEKEKKEKKEKKKGEKEEKKKEKEEKKKEKKEKREKEKKEKKETVEEEVD